MKRVTYTLIFLLFAITYGKAQFSGGTGDENNPYIIATAADLNNVRNYLSAGIYFLQTDNINISGYSNWLPIGTALNPFKGNFDGGGYQISNLASSGTVRRSLFGATDQTAVIQRVNVVNANIVGSSTNTAILVAINSGIMRNCSAAGTVKGTTNVGGVVGLNQGDIFDCSFSGTVSGVVAGGFAGNNTGDISNCYSSGSVSYEQSDTYLGGFVGQNSGNISSCYAVVNINGKAEGTYGGGFVSSNSGLIENCYSSGTVETEFDEVDETAAGGFVAINNGSITKSYCNGSVNGVYVGGFAVSGAPSSITSSFWNTSSYGSIGSPGGGTGKTEEELQAITTFTSVGWAFQCEVWGINVGENNGFPFLLWQDNYGLSPNDCWYWTGSSSSAWSTAGNWNNGVPENSSNVKIRDGLTNYPIISSGVTINNIDILGTQTSLTIDPTGSLTVNGFLTNEPGINGLVLKSSSSGSASIILDPDNDPVLATVERYVPSSSSVLFHLVSSPVSGQTITDFITDNISVIAYSTSGGVYAMKPYKTDGTGWDLNYPITQPGEVIPGKTYSIGVKANQGTLRFKGTLVNSNQDKTIIGTGTGFGWNGIGNPFASSLNANAEGSSFLGFYGDRLDPSYTGLYIWVPTANQYQVINGVPEAPPLSQSYLASAQGFIVKGKAGGGTVTFETGMRAHQNPTFHKSQKVTDGWSNLILQVQNASASVLTTNIAFNSEMNLGLDVGFDAGHLSDNANYKLFTKMPVESDLSLMVQALPSNWEDGLIIPVGLVYSTGGQVVFSIASMSLPDDVIVKLEDRLLNSFTDIKNQSYTVSIPESSNSLNRFYLHVAKAGATVDAILNTTDELTYCEGDNLSVTFSASPLGGSYRWFRNDVLIPDAFTSSLVVTTSGSYKVQVTFAGVNDLSEPKMIIVNPLPQSSISSTDELDYCQGDNIDVDFTASPAGGSYQWFKNGDPIANAIAAGYTATAPGEYSVEVTLNGCSAKSDASEVIVNELPTITVPDDFSVCAGETARLTATGNANTYVWSNSVVNGEDFTPTQTATYTVTATITATGCQYTDNVTVTLNPLPVVTAPADLDICLGESVTLFALGNANTYAWDNGVVNGQVFTPTATATYTVTGTNTATGCDATDKVVVTVNPLPTITIPNDFAVCLGEGVTLNATGTADEYNWNNNVINGEEFAPNQTTTYTVTARIAATGCEASDELTVVVNPLPTVTTTNDLSVCDGEEVTLIATGNADTYSWDNGVINGQAFIPSQTTEYTVTAAFTATGCESAAEVTVTVNPLPEILLASDTILLAVHDQYLFDAGAGYTSYLWFDESTAQTYLFVGSQWGEGVHQIWAEVTNEFACSTRDTAVVNVKTTTAVGVESPWSVNLYPNPTSGDINLNVSGLNSQKVNVTIISALGQLVYRNEIQVSGGQIQESINLSKSSAGVYMMIISDGANKLTRRIVIK